MSSFKRIFLLLSVLILTQCEHIETLYDSPNHTEQAAVESTQTGKNTMVSGPEMSPFLAEQMYYLGEKYSARKFTKKADAVLVNERTEPSKISTFKILDGSKTQLKEERIRLIQALVVGARERTPQYAARAQSSFDCWVEHSDEATPFSKSCKSRYMNSIEHIEARLKECVPDLLPQTERPEMTNQSKPSSSKQEVFQIIY